MKRNGGRAEGLFLGVSNAAQRIRHDIEHAARVDSTVLITGETGVGKELVARAIHSHSSRRSQPFVPVNCAAIPDPLMESELFGHEAGAFTDARTSRKGAFEQADGGTLFLDEVGDLSTNAQPKLLRTLETGTIQRLGSEVGRSVDIRIVAATNQDLRRMAKEGRFRRDLYYRLAVIRIDVPPLRQRPEDVPVLVEHFVSVLSRYLGRPIDGVTEAAMSLLTGYPWPGNVRELRSALEQALASSSGLMVDAEALRLDPASSADLDGLLAREWREAHDRFERIYVERLMKRHGGNVKAAAAAAGMTPRNLYLLLERFDLKRV